MGLSPALLSKLKKESGLAPLEEYTVERIPTGIIGLDIMLGGGIPRGRLTTISSLYTGYGKTTLAMLMVKAVANAPAKTMKNGGNVVIFDAEQTYSRDWATKLGIDSERVTILGHNEMTGEQVMEAIRTLVNENAVDLILVDSVKFLIFNSESSLAAGESGWAVAAKHWSYFRRQMVHPLTRSGIALVTINHAGKAMSEYEPNPEYGGDALPQWATIRINMMSPRVSDDKSKIQWVVLRPSVIKNKLTGARRKAEIRIVDGIIDPIPDLVKYGKQWGLFTKADGTILTGGGNWHYQSRYLGKSEKDVAALIGEDFDLFQQLYRAIMELLPQRAAARMEDDEGESANDSNADESGD